MDPSRNAALQNAKLHALLPSFLTQQQQQTQSTNTINTSALEDRVGGIEGMPPPPAYHSVINPNAPIPNLHSHLFDPDEDEKDEDDTPEVNINATTQIRGHGNIISIAQMDSVRIANLIAILLHGGVSPTLPPQHPAQAQQAHSPQQRHRPENRERRHWPKININVNCGATVIGDRNIVGPGLGDIARHMQMAQRNQAAQQQANLNANRTAPIVQTPGLGFPVHVQGMMTPPMSRSASLGSESSRGVKRKAENGDEESPPKRSG